MDEYIYTSKEIWPKQIDFVIQSQVSSSRVENEVTFHFEKCKVIDSSKIKPNRTKKKISSNNNNKHIQMLQWSLFLSKSR